jgi:hypothetical protein
MDEDDPLEGMHVAAYAVAVTIFVIFIGLSVLARMLRG